MKDSTKCYVMDVFTFLQELNVIDSKNKNTMVYYKLFDYTEESKDENMPTEESKAAPSKFQPSTSGV